MFETHKQFLGCETRLFGIAEWCSITGKTGKATLSHHQLAPEYMHSRIAVFSVRRGGGGSDRSFLFDLWLATFHTFPTPAKRYERGVTESCVMIVV